MGQILTPNGVKKEQCMNEVRAIMQKYGLILQPIVTITPAGMSMRIDIIEPAEAEQHSKGGA